MADAPSGAPSRVCERTASPLGRSDGLAPSVKYLTRVIDGAASEQTSDVLTMSELEQRDEAPANEMNVLGDRDANPFAPPGPPTPSRTVPPPPAPPLAVPDKADARAASPLKPCPPSDPGIARSFTISRHTPPSRRAMRIEHVVALLWRRTFVTPSRKAHAKSAFTAGDSVPAFTSTWVAAP